MASDGNTASLHHWIPQLYLKRFAADAAKPRVHVYDWGTGRSFQASPKKIAAEHGFNSIEIEGQAPDALEASLGRFEGEVGPAIQRTEAAGRFPDDNAGNLILSFIALVAVRTPGRRLVRAEQEAHVWRVALEMIMSSKELYESHVRRAQAEGDLDPALNIPYEEACRGEYKIEIPQTRRILQELELQEAVFPHLGARGWLFLKASPESGPFITSDSPVILAPNERAAEDGRLAYGLRGTDVFFPLTKTLLMLGRHDKPMASAEATAEQVARFNSMIIRQAERQIYAESDGFWFLDADGVRRRGSELSTAVGSRSVSPLRSGDQVARGSSRPAW